MKSNDADTHLQELENYKNLLKSLEMKREKQVCFFLKNTFLKITIIIYFLM